MRIVWQDEAEGDLDRIAEHILKDDPAAALRLVYTIREATRVLGEHPNIGRTGRVEGTRELVIPGLPYALPLSDCRSGGQDSGRYARIKKMAGNISVTSSVKRQHLKMPPARPLRTPEQPAMKSRTLIWS